MVTTTTITLYITKNKTLLINTNRDIKVMAHWYSNTKCINSYNYSGAYRLFILFFGRTPHIVIIVHYQYSYKLKFTEWENSGGPNQTRINQDPLFKLDIRPNQYNQMGNLLRYSKTWHNCKTSMPPLYPKINKYCLHFTKSIPTQESTHAILVYWVNLKLPIPIV